MKNLRILNIIIYLLLAFSISAQSIDKHGVDKYGRKTDRRTNALGAGGSQYSNKRKPDSHGLYKSSNIGVHSFIGLWQDDSYSTFIHNIPNVALTPGGGSTSFGFCYEYQIDRIRIQCGAGIRWQDVSLNVRDTSIVRDYVRDSQGYRYRLQYDFRNRTDRSKNLYAQVPILFGYGFWGCYMMVGAKFQLAFAGATCVRDTGVTHGTYEQYLGHYVEMDNHGLRKDVPTYLHKSRLLLHPDILLSGEIGYEWAWVKKVIPGRSHKWRENRFRIAAFADYSLLNINPKTSSASFNIPEGRSQWDFPAFDRNHVLSSDMTEGRHVQNLFAGVKFTILIGYTVQYRCRLCSRFGSEADW